MLQPPPSWSVSGVLDCAPGQGEFAKDCVEKRIQKEPLEGGADANDNAGWRQ